MDSLSPHIEHRVTRLHREADARRLAASGSTSHDGSEPRPRRRRALAIAAALLALATAISASGAYLVAAGTESAAHNAQPVVGEAGRSPVGESGQAAQPLPPAGGGIRLHR